MKHRKLYTSVIVVMVLLTAFVVYQRLAGISFDERFEVDAPADDVWTVLVESFEDSTTSPVWPRSLERVSTPRMTQGAVVDAVYDMGPLGHSEQAYRVTDFSPGDRTFTYRTGYGHPLDGGATVEVHAAEEDRAEVRWSGHYRVSLTPGSQLGAVFVRFVFLGRFFDHLRRRTELWAAERGG